MLTELIGTEVELRRSSLPSAVDKLLASLRENNEHGGDRVKTNKSEQDSSADRSVPLEDCLLTSELEKRTSREPDLSAERKVLLDLCDNLASNPGKILEVLVDQMLVLLDVESAGISMLDAERDQFSWPAVSGAWKEHVGKGSPRKFGTCGDALDHKRPLLFSRPQRRYSYANDFEPSIWEILVVPIYAKSDAVGTIWAVYHSQHRSFDKEHLRQLESLAKFAASAWRTMQIATRMQELEAQLRESKKNNDLKTEFVRTVSHEVRTPITAIIGLAECLTTMELEEETDEIANHIFKSSKHLLVILNDLLDFSKLEAGKITIDSVEFSPRELITEVTELFDGLCEQKQLTIRSVLSADIPERIKGDEQKIRQILTNLVSNAVKFSTDGNITIDGTSDKEAEKLIEMRLTVRDCGIGISKEKQSVIFEPFIQAETSTTRLFGGTGLGLSICKRYAELMGGKIGLESTEGKGSAFWFTVPVTKVA